MENMAWRLENLRNRFIWRDCSLEQFAISYSSVINFMKSRSIE